MIVFSGFLPTEANKAAMGRNFRIDLLYERNGIL